MSAPLSTMVAKRKQCSYRPTITPNSACAANLYRRIKRRVGCSLKRLYCQRHLVATGKQATYKLPRAQGSFSSLKRVSSPVHREDGSNTNRQYHRGSLHKQRGRHEIRSTLCPSMENLDLVYQQTSYSPGPTHPGSVKCSGRQALQTGADHSNRVVPAPSSLSGYMPKMAQTSNRPFRHKIQQETSPLCVSSSGPHCHCDRCTEPSLGGSGCLHFSSDSHLGQSGGKATRLPLQEVNSHCTGLAQHDLVLGSGGDVQPNPLATTSDARPANSAFQSDHPQESVKPKSPCLAPRAMLIRKQGFSQTVAARIEAPQRGSTRSVYEVDHF